MEVGGFGAGIVSLSSHHPVLLFLDQNIPKSATDSPRIAISPPNPGRKPLLGATVVAWVVVGFPT